MPAAGIDMHQGSGADVPLASRSGALAIEIMTETVAHFDVGYSRCLDAGGTPVGPLPDFAKDPSTLIALYKALVRTRGFDAKAVALQRTGRLGTFASSLGQEAVSVGLASAMRAEDVLVPSFREHGGQLLRGVTPLELFLYWGGDERGSAFAGPREDFPVSVPVGSHAPHAVGVALAFKLRHEKRVAVCVFGDGATSKGDVAEALNIAGVWRLPAVFVVSNNQWAISVPRQLQSAAETLAQKAIAAGFSGEQVDGNDVIAVRSVVGAAIERARAGEGPALVEAVTYRLGDHTTADDAGRYRDDSVVTPYWQEEPLLRLRRYLSNAGRWSREDEDHLLRETSAEIDAAAAAYLAMPPQDPAAVFDHLFAEMPAELRAQRDAMLAADGASAMPAAQAES
jgi:2-oxoisovalerate dehydrogenase E1 component alpha subunit